MTQENVSTFIANTLYQQDVRYVFGVSGGSIVPFFHTMKYGTAITAVLAKHEQGAAFMADGFARVSRQIGVCCTTSGPGATNALTGIYSANMDGSPVLALTGQPSQGSFGKGPAQDSSGIGHALNSPDIFRSATRYSEMLMSASLAPQMLSDALSRMREGRGGAAHISLPANLLSTALATAPLALRASARPSASSAEIEQLANLLVNAKRPVILAGNGVRLSGAEEALAALADHLQIPVATTLKGKGAFIETSPLSLGVYGSVTVQAVEWLLSPETDLLLVLGSALGEVATGGWPEALGLHEVTVQVDIDAGSLGKAYAFDHLVQADVRTFLEQTLETVETIAPARARRASVNPERLSAQAYQGSSQQLATAAVVRALSERLPASAKLFVDIGNCFSWAGELIEVTTHNSFFVPIGAGSMGCSIPMAIGGKFASPEDPVVALIGDGAFMMCALELHTAVEYDRPIVVVVLNNSGHGMVYGGETILWGQEVLSRYRQRVDIATVATGLGAEAHQIDTLDQFEAALTAALASHKTVVLDVHVDIGDIPQALSQRVNTLKQYFGKSA